MSLKPQPVPPVPEETARIARAAFAQGNRYLTLHDVLGAIITDDDFIDLFPARGRPAAAPWRLALVSVFQCIEGLSDRQAAEAVRSRIDWKYALRLDLVDPGFDHSVLSAFRPRLTTSGAEQRVFEVLVKHLTAQGWMRARGRQRTDATQVLAAIRVVNRFEEVGETVRHTLTVLAEVAPDGLYRVALPEWRERSGRRVEEYRLPEGAAAREQYAATVGAAGQHLLQALDQDIEHPWLRDLPAGRVLRQVWAEHDILTPGAEGTGEQVRWRTASELARPLQRLASPYDPEARYHIKRGTPWVG